MCKGERGQKKKNTKTKTKTKKKKKKKQSVGEKEEKKKDESMQGRKREWMCNKIQFFCFSFFAIMHRYRWLCTIARS